MTEADVSEQLAQGCYPTAPLPGIELTLLSRKPNALNYYTTESPYTILVLRQYLPTIRPEWAYSPICAVLILCDICTYLSP